jgi:hypothetical protein
MLFVNFSAALLSITAQRERGRDTAAAGQATAAFEAILISACKLRKSTADLDELPEFMLITYRPFRSIGDQDLGGCLHQAARPSGELVKGPNRHVVAVAEKKLFASP